MASKDAERLTACGNRRSRGTIAHIPTADADGKPLETDALPASLMLPMGRFGPAFLAFDNFKVYTEWNNSLAYSLTAAYYATRLAGAPAYNPGRGEKIPGLSTDDVRELQTILAKRGFDVGRIDGILGLKSR